jgi:hypothetical protein
MPLVGFEHTISGGERPQTYALDRAALGPALCYIQPVNYIWGYGKNSQGSNPSPTAQYCPTIPSCLPVRSVYSYVNDNGFRTFASKKFFGLVEIDWSARSRM